MAFPFLNSARYLDVSSSRVGGSVETALACQTGSIQFLSNGDASHMLSRKDRSQGTAGMAVQRWCVIKRALAVNDSPLSIVTNAKCCPLQIGKDRVEQFFLLRSKPLRRKINLIELAQQPVAASIADEPCPKGNETRLKIILDKRTQRVREHAYLAEAHTQINIFACRVRECLATPPRLSEMLVGIPMHSP